jgi:hypothetical protein
MEAPPLALLVSSDPKQKGFATLFSMCATAAVDEKPAAATSAKESSHPVHAVALHVGNIATHPALVEEAPDLLIVVAAESGNDKLHDCAADSTSNAVCSVGHLSKFDTTLDRQAVALGSFCRSDSV